MNLALSPTTTDAPENGYALMRANSELYEWLAGQAFDFHAREGAGEAVLGRVVAAAGFAAWFHTGRFADGTIENLAFEVGQAESLEHPRAGGEQGATPEDGRRRVLHVASHVIGIGGLTRMLNHWAGGDKSSRHSLAVLNQEDRPVPRWLTATIESSGGSTTVLPGSSGILQKAGELRALARERADLVVLHHDGHDVVPTVAFAVSDCPPVAVLNHADHQFWLGSSVADMVINMRSAASAHTCARRFVTTNAVLPIPLTDTARTAREAARETLGIGMDQIVLLSVGRGEKYRPCGRFDFVSTAAEILAREPGAHIYVVGESLAGISPFLQSSVPERLHFVGSVEDPSLYRAAADIYLESFPFGSQTALLEAALSGLPVVPAHAPIFPLLVANDDALLDLLPNPADERTYIDRAVDLMRAPAERKRLGSALRTRLLQDHVGEGWLDRLSQLYRTTDSLVHNPRPIPRTSSSVTAEDASLSLWHVAADGMSYGPAVSAGQAGLMRHTAFAARVARHYAMARHYAWRAVLTDPSQLMSWRLLGVTLLGPAARSLRAMLAQ